jgi:hypothetical protein
MWEASTFKGDVLCVELKGFEMAPQRVLLQKGNFYHLFVDGRIKYSLSHSNLQQEARTFHASSDDISRQEHNLSEFPPLQNFSGNNVVSYVGGTRFESQSRQCLFRFSPSFRVFSPRRHVNVSWNQPANVPLKLPMAATEAVIACSRDTFPAVSRHISSLPTFILFYIYVSYGSRRGSTWPRGYTPCWQVYTNKTRVLPFIPTKSVAWMSMSWLLGNVYTAKSCKGKKRDPDGLKLELVS